MPCKLLQDAFLAQAVAMQCRWRCIDSHHCIPLPRWGNHDAGPGLPGWQGADDAPALQQQVGAIATRMCVSMDMASMPDNTCSVHGCCAISLRNPGEARTLLWLLSVAAALCRTVPSVCVLPLCAAPWCLRGSAACHSQTRTAQDPSAPQTTCLAALL